MINLQPAFFCLYWSCPCPYTCAIPHSVTSGCHTFVVSPMQAVGRFCQPYIIAAKFGTARAMKSEILVTYLLFEQCTIFIMRWEYHSMPCIVFPIIGVNQSNPYSYRRYFCESKVKTIFGCCNTAILNAECFQLSFSENRWKFRFIFEVNTVGT